MYSQNDEESIILDFFKDYEPGTLLDLGANDGKTLSNSLALIELGWKGTLVEASPSVYPRLVELHESRDYIDLINMAVGKENGFGKFFESGELLGKGDISLVSSLKAEEKIRWSGLNTNFKEIDVEVVDFKTLLSISKYKKFDFVTIDIEGMEVDVVPQINFKELGTRIAIIEWNGKDANVYDSHMSKFGFQLIHVNGENRIYTL